VPRTAGGQLEPLLHQGSRAALGPRHSEALGFSALKRALSRGRPRTRAMFGSIFSFKNRRGSTFVYIYDKYYLIID